ncbi:hypothetical protein BRADI_5g21475v3 [Brachypodium distachyon]|uniref:Uncharacterized protein n=1 Tax=Brachypodium distachyon TaxID=15368 RepID=A0A0Q3H8J8_BRADI|nr:hypothetical protein BRADI_5g21475v3 [Brachypodium distachyon]
MALLLCLLPWRPLPLSLPWIHLPIYPMANSNFEQLTAASESREGLHLLLQSPSQHLLFEEIMGVKNQLARH